MSLNTRVLDAVGRHWPVTRTARWLVLSLSEDALRAQLETARILLEEVLSHDDSPPAL